MTKQLSLGLKPALGRKAWMMALIRGRLRDLDLRQDARAARRRRKNTRRAGGRRAAPPPIQKSFFGGR